MTSVNAEQPQVRAGSLPTQTPRTIQRPAQPQVAQGAAQPAEASAHPAEGAEAAQGAETPVAKPKRQYKPRKPKAQLSDADLSPDELAAWGLIALEARKAGVSVEKYMTDLERSVGLKLQVWSKLKPAQASAEQPEPTPETAADA